MLGFLSKTIDRCFAVGGAFIFCQLPLLMQQYTMVLSGHLAESRREINLLQHAATLSNKTLQEYIQKFLGQQDLDFVHQGEIMQALQSRYNELSYSYAAIQEASVWTKPLVFISKVDMGVFWDTFHDFTFGISTNFETLIYAFVGLGFGVLVYRLLAKIVMAIISFFRAKPKAGPGAAAGGQAPRL